MIRLTLGTLLAGSVIALFWWLVGDRLSIPAWQVVAVPAAMAGWILGAAVARSRRWIIGIFLTMLSCILGTWWPIHAEMSASRETRAESVQEQVLQAIARMQEGQTDLDSPMPADEPPGQPASVPDSKTNNIVTPRKDVSLGLSLRLMVDQARRDPWPIVLHALIALVIMLQAARWTGGSRSDRPVTGSVIPE